MDDDVAIVVELCIDLTKPISETLIKGCHDCEYDPNEDDIAFLKRIEGKLWDALDPEEKIRAIQIYVANMVYEGVVEFDYTTIEPKAAICPTCFQPMDIFDEPEETGPRYVCHHCKQIITIEPFPDDPDGDEDEDDDEEGDGFAGGPDGGPYD